MALPAPAKMPEGSCEKAALEPATVIGALKRRDELSAWSRDTLRWMDVDLDVTGGSPGTDMPVWSDAARDESTALTLESTGQPSAAVAAAARRREEELDEAWLRDSSSANTQERATGQQLQAAAVTATAAVAA